MKTNKDFSVRLATKEDVDELVKIGKQTFEETFVGDFSRPYKKEDLLNFFAESHSPEVYHKYLNDSKHRLYVLYFKGKMEGYSLVGPCSLPHKGVSDSCGELKRIYINKNKQGYGYGKALLEKSLSYLDENFTQQWIGVWSENIKAQKIYHSYNFEKVGDYIFPVGDVLDKEFILRKKLSKTNEI